MIAAVLVFSAQDGISRHLGSHYSVFSIVMLRYWAFALFGLWLVGRTHGSWRVALATPFRFQQVLRGLILAAEICVMQVAFVKLGLIETHAIFTTAPLMVAALSGPFLGEKVGWRRWTAICVGCLGMMIILQPGAGVFSPLSLIALLGAFLYALYGLATRFVGRADSSAISFFWMGAVGAAAMTAPGLWLWQPMTAGDSGWMLVLSCSGILGHWLLIRSYEVGEASAVQPLGYLQLVFISIFGITIFGEALRWNVVVGAVIVVGAGLFTLWRQRVRAAVSSPSVLP